MRKCDGLKMMHKYLVDYIMSGEEVHFLNCE